ncbi:hypothetical protein HDV62DRAFT_357722 [Trichoderma sp. SZMC 28011]
MERCLGSLVCLLLDLVCVCLAGYVLRNSNPALLTSHPLFSIPRFSFFHCHPHLPLPAPLATQIPPMLCVPYSISYL